MTVALATYGITKIDESIYSTLLAALSVGGFVNWFAISLSHLRFRWAFVAQGYDIKRLKYYANWFPIGPFTVMGICLFIAVSCNIDSMKNGEWGTVFIKYLSAILALVLYTTYKIVKKTKMVPLLEIDLKTSANLKPIDQPDELEEPVLDQTNPV
jgi:lysine-specific permease